MGLLEIADLIGLDTILLSLIALRDQLDSTVFEPAALLSKMVAEGKLGQKSGQGFYHYDQK
jgi:3-hydroxybutyryl-CoA dehydrogenase